MMETNCQCSGTDFEVINCPSFNCGYCFRVKSNSVLRCKEIKNCIIKDHLVALSALVNVCLPGTPQLVGAKCCFNSFLVNNNPE